MTAARWHAPQLTATDQPTAVLTPRQADVLTLICQGHTHAQIGRRLGGVSAASIRSTARLVYRALDAHDRAHAAALACSGQVDVIVKGNQ